MGTLGWRRLNCWGDVRFLILDMAYGKEICGELTSALKGWFSWEGMHNGSSGLVLAPAGGGGGRGVGTELSPMAAEENVGVVVGRDCRAVVGDVVLVSGLKPWG